MRKLYVLRVFPGVVVCNFWRKCQRNGNLQQPFAFVLLDSIIKIIARFLSLSRYAGCALILLADVALCSPWRSHLLCPNFCCQLFGLFSPISHKVSPCVAYGLPLASLLHGFPSVILRIKLWLGICLFICEGFNSLRQDLAVWVWKFKSKRGLIFI